jgi:uncharacterized membrane protein YvlD (DUF360 family)
VSLTRILDSIKLLEKLKNQQNLTRDPTTNSLVAFASIATILVSILILIIEPFPLCLLLPIDFPLQLGVFILYPGNDILELEIARTIDGPEYPHFPWIPVAVIFAQRREGISKKGRE